MKLIDLIKGVAECRLEGDRSLEISGLAYDSRLVEPGMMFFATARDPQARRIHMQQALERGARALVARSWEDVGARPSTALITCQNPRALMAVAASRFYHAPSERLDLIGITGTSGKTTTTTLLAAIFEAAGTPGGTIGTLGIHARGIASQSSLTTPEAIDFEAALDTMQRAGVPRVAAEISSIGLAEGRVDQLSFRAGLFTNFGRDHLDYHGTIDNYFAAKLRLFTELLPRSRRGEAVAVARGDEPWGRRVLQATSVRKVSFGLASSVDVYPRRFKAGIGGIDAVIQAFDQVFEISSPLLGEINLLNILAAAAVSVALGIETDAVVEGVRRCPGAPGRLEPITGPPGVTVLVDYAHKPDALEGVLKTLRALNPGRLVCVFGCGGDRDRGKRPLMGSIAGRLADRVIVTSDNPRTEEPMAIIAAIEEGLRDAGRTRCAAGDRISAGYVIEPDRRAAIALALQTARAGDLIVIAGKGHEDYQIIGTEKRHFDDREVVRELVNEIASQSLTRQYRACGQSD
jgi:UDP-N-acetylmuramoyl-L-alanyl-D-glutamate--2,6-diaminopimelate ligase